MGWCLMAVDDVARRALKKYRSEVQHLRTLTLTLERELGALRASYDVLMAAYGRRRDSPEHG